MDYGFGAVFGCPAHDQRDMDFALKYQLEIKTVVKPFDKDETFKVKDKAYVDGGEIINSKFLNGLKVPEESIIKTINILEERKLGEKNKLQIKRLGCFSTKILGMPYSYNVR